MNIIRPSIPAGMSGRNELVSMLTGLCPEVETSAEQTLRSLARAFGSDNVSFEFLHERQKASEALLS